MVRVLKKLMARGTEVMDWRIQSGIGARWKQKWADGLEGFLQQRTAGN